MPPLGIQLAPHVKRTHLSLSTLPITAKLVQNIRFDIIHSHHLRSSLCKPPTGDQGPENLTQVSLIVLVIIIRVVLTIDIL
jgi:hypothetical protein